tara:strand:+ start:111 stop:578 length:468 start_codon:yes stop_codon:yes gene_type:complete
MLKVDYKWMKLALKEAKLARKNSEVPVGAVLVNLLNNELISKSGNKIIKKSNPLLHAEIEVILKGVKFFKSRYLNNTAIYITLEPCLMCAAAISEARISRIYFGAYDKKKGAIENGICLLNKKSYFKPEIYGGILKNDCSKLLKDFFKNVREKKK